jgi:hypothetical protein
MGLERLDPRTIEHSRSSLTTRAHSATELKALCDPRRKAVHVATWWTLTSVRQVAVWHELICNMDVLYRVRCRNLTSDVSNRCQQCSDSARELRETHYPKALDNSLSYVKEFPKHSWLRIQSTRLTWQATRMQWLGLRFIECKFDASADFSVQSLVVGEDGLWWQVRARPTAPREGDQQKASKHRELISLRLRRNAPTERILTYSQKHAYDNKE